MRKKHFFLRHNRHYVFQTNSLYSELCRSLVFVNVDTKAKKCDTRNREDLIDYAHTHHSSENIRPFHNTQHNYHFFTIFLTKNKKINWKRSESISKEYRLLSIFELFPICTLYAYTRYKGEKFEFFTYRLFSKSAEMEQKFFKFWHSHVLIQDFHFFL